MGWPWTFSLYFELEPSIQKARNDVNVDVIV